MEFQPFDNIAAKELTLPLIMVENKKIKKELLLVSYAVINELFRVYWANSYARKVESVIYEKMSLSAH